MICPSCGKDYTPDLMTRPDWADKFKEWKYERKVIQHVWPNAQPFQREQLQTGICSDKCWDDFLGPEEDLEPSDGMTDAEADADTLASAGWGTDEDYGYYGGEE